MKDKTKRNLAKTIGLVGLLSFATAPHYDSIKTNLFEKMNGTYIEAMQRGETEEYLEKINYSKFGQEDILYGGLISAIFGLGYLARKKKEDSN